ncbi:hypothetical protein TIFTF001_025025 [Ficus carica]|uniref:Uncharacterized protein n=1 Tax=Ficus carica TaxID=3494 RepID=A0AA88DH41_FICCA|nr:hypothetical protein TIFTF001_025025 [Ficus carica]
MKLMISCRTSAALFALILIEIVLCSSPCLCHEQNILQRDHQRSFSLSRKLLMASISHVMSQDNINKLQASSATKEPKKAVETSLRKAPASGPNPTQNK